MFTMFTDRDGKSQLMSLSESSLDPLSRTTRFMLTEEAHHMFVGETGIARIVERTCQLMKRPAISEDVRKVGGIDLPTIQKHLNLWFSLASTCTAARSRATPRSYFANGLKGRAKEDTFDDHVVKNAYYNMEVFEDGKAGDEGSADAQRDERGPARLVRRGLPARRRPLEPDHRGARHVGSASAAGSQVPPPHRHVFRPPLRSQRRAAERGGVGAAEVRLAAVGGRHRVPAQPHGQPVYEPGKFANYIAPPRRGINQQPIDFEYVRTEALEIAESWIAELQEGQG